MSGNKSNPLSLNLRQRGHSYSVIALLLLGHGVDHIHNLLCQGISFFASVSLSINTDDGFCVGLAEVYPLVGKVNLHSIDVSDLLVFVDFLNLLKQGKDIGGGFEIDAIF